MKYTPYKVVRKTWFKHRIAEMSFLQQQLDQSRAQLADATIQMAALNEEIFRLRGHFASNEEQSAILDIVRSLAPKRVLGPWKKERFGGNADGGYVMLPDFDGIATAISLGVGNEVSWDLDLAEKGIKVKQFDHSVDAPPIGHRNFEFFKRRVSVSSGENEILFSEIIKEFCLDGSTAILKMDIEGDEWSVLGEVEAKELTRFAQIICEFHFFDHCRSRDFSMRALSALQNLKQVFEVIHVHGNNYASFALAGNIPLPEVLEVTFANKSRYEFGETAEIFPTSIDRPNNAASPDLLLGSFKF